MVGLQTSHDELICACIKTMMVGTKCYIMYILVACHLLGFQNVSYEITNLS